MFKRKINEKIINYLNENVVFSPCIDLENFSYIKVDGVSFVFDDIVEYRRLRENKYIKFSVNGKQLSF